ncbi:hypothetical protein [Mesorhizobium sp. M7A.F.Ca.MR.245.00.0.0]|uniref:hypothetical protein n=1 Tax=Mesorhizobium sp. M7A.F.Ca.MR.245.00.0.0 TaxID=2496778 RepID=UPI0013E34CD5|nr:hypothetical protein [Mesorhizobium sp. M7A.F.Ca.MR.245.00.0.0]
MPDPENEKAMYLPSLYDLSIILDRLAGARIFYRANGPDRDQIVGELRRLAANETKEAA